MPNPGPEAITKLLTRAANGDDDAKERLWQIVYPRLKEIAHRELARNRPESILQTTELVHEAYLKLVDRSDIVWKDRVHFYSLAARATRLILIDHARTIRRAKRGGGQRPLQLDESALATSERADFFLALDNSLARLSSLSERLGSVVEYRFFGGMNDQEIAHALRISKRTVRRDWRKARAWLAADLAEPSGEEWFS